jgi:hypothetical protein
VAVAVAAAAESRRGIVTKRLATETCRDIGVSLMRRRRDKHMRKKSPIPVYRGRKKKRPGERPQDGKTK